MKFGKHLSKIANKGFISSQDEMDNLISHMQFKLLQREISNKKKREELF